MDKQGPIDYLQGAADGNREETQVHQATASSNAAFPPAQGQRAVAIWLYVICILVFAMVVLGGVTRLTESGLSMTDWRPVTGWLPPMTTDAWQAQFDAYRTSPEYNKINAGMSLADFKGIFWLEYLHRLFGRIIGLAFAVPCLVFIRRGWVTRPLMWRLGGLFVLGGMQGLIGWWMVKSGLVDHPDVSQYRLAVHLGMAFVILGATLWTALDLNQPRQQSSTSLRRWSTFTLVLIFLTILSGALVAGLNAGMIYNTFPKMLGDWFPPEGFQLAPWYLNLFEDIPTVQFDHRWLAVTTFFVVIITARTAWQAGGAARRHGITLLIAACVQIVLGIATLLSVVALPLAALHQASAVVLFAAAVRLRHGLRN